MEEKEFVALVNQLEEYAHQHTLGDAGTKAAQDPSD
jgi:hypothetical protein